MIISHVKNWDFISKGTPYQQSRWVNETPCGQKFLEIWLSA